MTLTFDHTYTNTHCLSLTALRQHTDSYIYGAPHQLSYVLESLCDVLSLQTDFPFTSGDLM